MMKVTEIAIRRPAFVTMIFVALAVLGIFGYNRMGVDLLPKMDWPYVSIITVYPGAGPREVESLVSKPLEEAVSGIGNLDNVRSYSYEGVSVVLAQFGFSSEVDVVTNDVQRKIDLVRNTLPEDVQEPRISKADMNAFPIMRVSLTGRMEPRDLYQFAKDRIKDRLEQVSGVSSVTLVGGREREIRVEVDNGKLRTYGLSILQVSAALRRENLDFPAGKIDEPVNQYIVRLAGKFRALDEVGAVVVASSPSGEVRLRDIATVKDAWKEDYTLSRLNGESSVALVIQKQSDANSVRTSEMLRLAMDEFEAEQGHRVKFTIAQDITEFTRHSISEVERDLFLAILMVATVLFLFLGDARNSVIVLLSIPTSMITTFFFMWLLDYTLNLVSLMALALVIGILVDDSIVVLESIHRHLARGEEPARAAVNGRSEIGFAAVAITLVDVVVFLPISLVGGVVGRIFSEFGITIVVSTLLSLFVSFTLTPMLAAKWTKLTDQIRGNGAQGDGRLRRFAKRFERLQGDLSGRYARLLEWSLDHRKAIVGLSGGLLAASLALIPLGLIGTEFITETDRGEFAVNIDLPLGTSIVRTDRAIAEVEKVVASIPEVERHLTTVGRQQTEWKNAEQSNVGQIQVKLVDAFDRDRSSKEVMMDIQRRTANVPGVKTSFAVMGMWGMAAASPVQIEVIGSDLDTVTAFAARVSDILAGLDGIADVRTSWEEGKPEVQISVDRDRAAMTGLTPGEVGLAVRTAIEGDVATKFKEGDTEYDTRVVLDRKDRASTADVGSITLMNRYGQPVALSQVAEISRGKGPSEIQRKNRERLVTVTSNLSGTAALGEVVAAAQQRIEAAGVPSGVRIYYGGEAENMRDMFSDMSIALGLAVLFVYMIMVSLFESYLHPLTIMFSLPLALVGALGSLAATGMTLNMFSMIGVIMLMGLVTKNAILLVDRTNVLRGRGEGLREALLDAGRTRLRPILMTTSTMVFGMLPLALALGAGSAMRQSMAVVVIWGLISSTLLTLVLVPVVYAIVDDLRRKVPALVRGRRGTDKDAETVPHSA